MKLILWLRYKIYAIRFYLKTGLTMSRLKRLWIKLMEDAELATTMSIEQGLQMTRGSDWRAVKLKNYGLLILQTHIVLESGLMIYLKAAYDNLDYFMVYTTTADSDWKLVLVPGDFENKFVDGEWRKVLKAMCKEML